jgi:hypothetical protein
MVPKFGLTMTTTGNHFQSPRGICVSWSFGITYAV